MNHWAKQLCRFLTVVLCVLLIPAQSVKAAGNSMDTATNISVNTSYSGSITSSNTQDYYKFTISSGTVNVRATWNIEEVRWQILDADGDQIYNFYPAYDSTLGENVTNVNCHLTGGTYYFVVKQFNGHTGSYNFRLNYTSAGESFPETQSSPHNNIATAASASVNKQYQGIIAENDTADFYKFTIASGIVNVKATWNLEEARWQILDAEGDQIYNYYPAYDSTLGENITDINCYLTGGTYYFVAKQFNGHTGTYSFKLNYTSAGESFSETQSAPHNNIATASFATANVQYKGFIAENDTADYYKFTILSGTMHVSAVWNIQEVRWQIFNSSGSSLYSYYPSYSTSTGKNITEIDCELTSGTYYFAVTQYSGHCGTYTFTLKGSTNAPKITTAPKSVTVSSGSTAKFTVGATGPSLTYQWQWMAKGGSSWTNCTSATTGYNKATLQVSATAARNGYKYRCKVSNSYGYVYTSPVTLTVSTTAKPAITTQPKSVSTASGNVAKFTVAASGSNLKYQWQWSSDGGSTWTNCSSSTTGYNKATLQVNAVAGRNGYKYRCKVSNSAGTVTSSAATLTVASKPTITTQPKSKVVSPGTSVSFSVTASGSGLKYQWYYRTSSSGTWQKSTAACATTRTYTLSASSVVKARSGYQYKCVVSNSVGSVTSNIVTLIVE